METTPPATDAPTVPTASEAFLVNVETGETVAHIGEPAPPAETPPAPAQEAVPPQPAAEPAPPPEGQLILVVGGSNSPEILASIRQALKPDEHPEAIRLDIRPVSMTDGSLEREGDMAILVFSPAIAAQALTVAAVAARLAKARDDRFAFVMLEDDSTGRFHDDDVATFGPILSMLEADEIPIYPTTMDLADGLQGMCRMVREDLEEAKRKAEAEEAARAVAAREALRAAADPPPPEVDHGAPKDPNRQRPRRFDQPPPPELEVYRFDPTVLECTIERDGPTTIHIKNRPFTFTRNLRGHYVCQVADRGMRNYLLSQPGSFRIYCPKGTVATEAERKAYHLAFAGTESVAVFWQGMIEQIRAMDGDAFAGVTVSVIDRAASRPPGSANSEPPRRNVFRPGFLHQNLEIINSAPAEVREAAREKWNLVMKARKDRMSLYPGE
jgi:hypothetical protein